MLSHDLNPQVPDLYTSRSNNLGSFTVEIILKTLLVTPCYNVGVELERHSFSILVLGKCFLKLLLEVEVWDSNDNICSTYF